MSEILRAVSDFANAALPWVAMGIAVAVCCAYSAMGKKESE